MELITTCAKCGTEFSWNSSYQELPDCPRCGYNQKRQFQQGDISDLVRMLASKDRHVASGAAAELGKRGDRRAVGPLIVALNNSDAQLAAVIALGKLRDKRAVEPLISILLKGQGPIGSAAESLVKIGTSRALKVVAENIESIITCPRQFCDVFDLFKGYGKSIVPILIPMLSSRDHNVRKHATQVLAELDWQPQGQTEQIKFYILAENWEKLRQLGSPARTQLYASLIGNASGTPRKRIANALKEIGWNPETNEEKVSFWMAMEDFNKLVEIGTGCVETLIKALTNYNEFIRRLAAEVLGKIGNPRAVEPLILRLKDKEVSVRVAAIRSLGALGDSQAVEPLFARLKDREDLVRNEVAYSLRAIGDACAVKALILMLKDKEVSIQIAAIESLGDLRDSQAVEPLIAMLKDKEVSVRVAAIRSLGALGDSQAVEPLIAMLKDKRDLIRGIVAGALGAIGDSRAVGPLFYILTDRNSDVRSNAAKSLSLIGTPALKALLNNLNNKNPDVRQCAAMALGYAKDMRVVRKLVTMLSDPNRNVRCTTAESLGRLGDQQAVPMLTKALRDSSPEVRSESAKALGLIGDSRAVLVLKAASRDKDPYVCDCARRALRKITGEEPKIEGCFIATACYGSADCSEVTLLRKFRDERLLHSILGRVFVRLYYLLSPPAASVIRRHPLLRSVVRRLLIAPVVKLVLITEKHQKELNE